MEPGILDYAEDEQAATPLEDGSSTSEEHLIQSRSCSRSPSFSRSRSPSNERWAPPSPRPSPPPASQIDLKTLPLNTYHPLPRISDAIRLVRLRPSDPESPALPVCTTEYHFLDHHPPYCALSYSWGAPEDMKDLLGEDDPTYLEIEAMHDVNVIYIILDGQLFGVRMNLWFFLGHMGKRLRDPGFVGYDLFWIDAICIDQEHVEERNSQVSIMDQIYREASQVLVWLGADIRKDASLVKDMVYRLIDMGQKLAKESAKLGVSNIDVWRGHPEPRRCLEEAGLPAFEHENWRAFCAFFRRSWFSRLWILQEVAQAQYVVMLCGDVEFEIGNLAICTTILQWGIDLQLGDLWLGDRNRKFIPPGDSLNRVWQIARWCHTDEHPFEDKGFGWLRLALNGTLDTSSGGAVWNTLLLICDRANVTLPVDRVFALMGIAKCIAPEARLPMRVDYSLSEHQAQYKLTCYILAETEWLQSLTRVQHESNAIAYPSWVPGFKQFEGNQIAQHSNFNATMSLNGKEMSANLPMFQILDHPHLLVHGTKLDKVSDFSDPYVLLYTEAAKGISEILVKCNSTYQYTGERLSRIAWKTLVGWQKDNEPSEYADRLERSFHSRWLYIYANATAAVAIERLEFSEETDLRKDLHELFQSEFPYYQALLDMLSDSVFPSLDEIIEEIVAWGITEAYRDEGGWMNLENTAPLDALVGDGHEFRLMVAKIAIGRRFFRTENGFIGLAPDVVEENDEVWLLPRMTVPMILRPIHKAQEDDSVDSNTEDLESANVHSDLPTYVVIGESYVHGVMFGEMIKKWQAEAADGEKPWEWERIVLT